MAVQPKDLGLVSAYGAALEGGYTGTYDEYKTKMLELLNLNLSSLGNNYDDTALQSSVTTIRAAIDTLNKAKVNVVDLSAVAMSGSYNDLNDKPTISGANAGFEGYSDGRAFPYAARFLDKPAGGYDADGNLVHSWQDLIDQGYIKMSQEQNYSLSTMSWQIDNTFTIPWRQYIRNNYSDPPPYQGTDIVTLVVESHDWFPYISASFASSFFRTWTGIKRVIFKQGLISIPPSMFDGCTSLEEVYVPDSVRTIGDYAFQTQGKFLNLYLPSTLVSLGACLNYLPKGSNVITGLLTGTMEWPRENKTGVKAYMFRSSQVPPSIWLPSGMRSIGTQAFENCTNLVNVNMPDTLTTIGSRAFAKCTGIETITIPKSVTTIESTAFAECTNLKTIYYQGSAGGAPWGATTANVVKT